VLNPVHLRRFRTSVLGDLVAVLRWHGIEPDLLFTRAGTPLAPQVAEEAARYDLFLVWGGDGTVGDVATGLIGTGTPLGPLPAGTYNNIARALGLPPDPLAAARLLADARPRSMDVGFAGGRLFLEAAGVGLDAAVFPFGERLKARDLSALLPALLRLVRCRAAEMTLDLDDARGIRVRAPLVAIANGPFYGAGFTVAPEARWDDGRLTVRVFEDTGLPALAWYFINAAWHRLPRQTTGLSFRARRVRVSSREPLAVHADGRVVGATPMVFEAQAGALCVLAPAGPLSAGPLRRRRRVSMDATTTRVSRRPVQA
jgi:diacylglycerol kinase (ATP)